VHEWESPIRGDAQARKSPEVLRRLGADEVSTSSERVGGAEGAVGRPADVGASGCADIS